MQKEKEKGRAFEISRKVPIGEKKIAGKRKEEELGDYLEVNRERRRKREH